MATFRVGQSRLGALDRLVLGGSSPVAVLVAQALYLRGLEQNVTYSRSAYLDGQTALSTTLSDYLSGVVATVASQAEYLFAIEALPAQRAAYLRGVDVLAQSVADFCAGIEALGVSRAGYLLAPSQVSLAVTLGAYARGLQALTTQQLSAYLSAGVATPPVAVLVSLSAYLAGWIPPLGFEVTSIDYGAQASVVARDWSASAAVLTQSAGHIAETGG